VTREASLPIYRFDTALGRCGLRWSDAGISAVHMPGSRALDRHAAAAGEQAPAAVRAAADAIVALLDGERADLRWIALDERRIEPFAQRVYRAAREIAPGTTATYGELATAIGQPDAARDVGAALARNRCPIVVPCHRVLAAGGALHGVSAPGGIATKRRMLEIERAPGFAQRTLFA
jgi:methylated-DNA-[protein]-cysteine S-methyltransferase